MSQANQVQMMNTLKRKLSSNISENDFQSKKALTNSADILSSSSSAFVLIDQFLMEEQSKGVLNISNQHLDHKYWMREPLLVQFIEIVVKLIEHKDDPNPLEYVLPDIELLCIEILGLQGTGELKDIHNTIVTSALQVSKDKELHGDDKLGLVKVEPKPKKGIISAMISFAVQIAVKIVLDDSPTPPSPNPVLEGNYAPIRQETSPTSDLKVKGEIPANLNGMMIRTGPNPAYDPVGIYSWMDGDSMFHGMRFKDGKATFVSRYIQTSRLKQENFFGEPIFLQYGDLEGKFGLFMSCVQLLRAKLEVLDVSYGWLNANTSLVYHDGKLMALQDFDKPYVVNISQSGDLDTLGINDYHKRLGHSVLPHSKKDASTGELFVVGVSYTPPYAIYNYVSKEGVMSNPVELNSVSGPTFMHDLGITKNYVIFMELPYCYDPEYMAKYGDWVYMFNTEKKPRFGILPRYATTEEKIKWFEFDNDSFFMFHNGNSWEEDDDTLVLLSCTMKPLEAPPGQGVGYADRLPKKTKLFFNPAHVANGRKRRNASGASVYNGSRLMQGMRTLQYSENNIASSGSDNDGEELVPLTLPTLYKFTFNMKTGDACLKELFKTTCDYPKINENYMGKKSQYLYTGELNKDSKVTAIVKTDLKWNNELKFELGDNKFGSEAPFVPFQLNAPLALAEDDGFLTTFVHDENVGVSYTYVIDARKMELSAVVELPTRVPYGFHATFVTEDEIQAQKP